MARGNDAIPSWSGFNYQGKMMLLCVMEKIYSIIASGKDLTKHQVELENREDYVFIEDGNSSHFYQVKATLSKSKWEEYEEALKKLIEHKNSSDNIMAPCYFVVARPIDNWISTTNPYKSSVNIYKYNGREVGVDEVKEQVYAEIEKILTYKGTSFRNIEAIYGDLCIFVDDKIAYMHTQGYKSREYRIGLKEFLDVVLNAVHKEELTLEYKIKEKTYEYMVKGIQESLKDICQNACHRNYEECLNACAAKSAYKKMLELEDIRKYCKCINPAVINGWENEMSYATYFSKENISNYILGIFFESKDATLVEDKGNVVGMKSEMNPLPQGLVVPTLLAFEERFVSIEDSMQNKLQVIRENTEVLDELPNNSSKTSVFSLIT